MFVQPTKDLITETITGIRQHSPDIRLTAIHSDTTENVVADIVQHTKDAAEHQGEILFITHASFLRLPYFHNAAEWHVIVDEIFQADQGFDFNMPYTHSLITRAFEVVPHNAEYGRVIPSDFAYLDTVSRNRLGTRITRSSAPSRPRCSRPIGKPSCSTEPTSGSSGRSGVATTSYLPSPC